ncbi:hemicentin-1-like isoform X2 [Tubulanus polymorphus]|uniref:hemicentin-1-like isoform X2 n=1 Tax=Tubulanus polymorphus TaxID=672921 RepID=UPI003DA38584
MWTKDRNQTERKQTASSHFHCQHDSFCGACTENMASSTVIIPFLTSLVWIPFLHCIIAQGYSMVPKPAYNETPTNVSVGPGEIALLRCSIRNLGTKTVTWRRKSEKHPLTVGKFTFVSDTRISVNHRRKSEHLEEWNLVIRNVQESDENLYECQISTRPTMVKDFSLKVKERPLEGGDTVKLSGTNVVENGTQIYLLCNATGMRKPPEDITWYKSGDKINSNVKARILITKHIRDRSLISVLVIERSRPKDRGTYTCEMTKDISASIDIKVYNVGTANVKRDPSSTNVTVRTGGSTVLKCRVHDSCHKTVIWRKASSVLPLAVGSLKFVGDNRIKVTTRRKPGNVTEYNLKIRNAELSDDDIYDCQIRSKSTLLIKVFNLTVFAATNNNINATVRVTGTRIVEAGRRLYLLCNATGTQNNSPADISWFKDGKILHSDAVDGILITKYYLTSTTIISVLIIGQSRLNHTGKYACQMTPGNTYGSANVKIIAPENEIDGAKVKVAGNRIVAENDKLSLFCNATGSRENPPDNVSWLKDGKELHTNSDDGVLITKYYLSRTSLFSVLIIEYSQLKDGGQYTCQMTPGSVFDTVSVDIYTGELDVENRRRHRVSRRDIFQRSSVTIKGKSEVESGGRLYLLCNATGSEQNPPRDISWFRYSSELHSNSADGILITKRLYRKTLLGILVIARSRMNDTGLYTCQMTPDKLRASVYVEVSSRNYLNRVRRDLSPRKSRTRSRALTTRFNPSPSYNVTITTGETALLVCSVHNLGPKTVTWRRASDAFPLTVGSFKFVTDDRISVTNRRISGNVDEYNLIIRDARLSDQDKYECQISSKPKLSQVFILTVMEIKRDPTGSLYVQNGKQLYLLCNATSGDQKLPDDITWYKDGRELHSNVADRLLITKHFRLGSMISVLVIGHSLLNHTGQYSCQMTPGYIHDTVDVEVYIPSVVLTGTELVQIGHQLYLVCNATGIFGENGAAMEWYKDGALLRPNPKKNGFAVSNILGPNGHTLVSILAKRNSHRSDSGVYSCKEPHYKSHELTVEVFPKFSISLQGTNFVEVGNVLYLMCNVSGLLSAPNDITWYSERGEVIVEKGQTRISITKVVRHFTLISVLKIEETRLSDGGTYTCEVNEFESSSLRVHMLERVKKYRKSSQSSSAAGSISSVGSAVAALIYTHFFYRVKTVME